ncbi:MAG: ABC transporter permease, partial [Desulforhopalus sp.]|nr:ABC transporter permease [Desulforhopalus sp.]
MDLFIPAMLTIITAATPLLFAALGEMVTEKSGVLNLGVEGMMVMGAIIGFVAVHYSGSITVAILASILAGAFMATIFALFVLKFHASQVPTGLALTIFGIGLSALVGQSMVGIAYNGIPTISIPLLSKIPVLGALLFEHDFLVYLSIAMVVAIH